jgi:glycosyltransferase involved in cell wall biosynthesis
MPIRISIITPTRNMARFLEPCILSVMQQCYPNFEHIIIDGASTDNTREVLSRYPHLRWISEADRGMSDALNKGIRMATGEIIGQCNADDEYLPGTLVAVDELYEENPEIDFLYGDVREINEAGRSRRVNRQTHFSPLVLRWMHVTTIPTATSFWRRRIHDSDLWFDEKMRYAMDYDFQRRVLAKGYKFKHVSILFADFRFHGGSKTAEGGQHREHELVVYREASAIWKKLGPAFLVLRYGLLLAVRAARTVEKCMKGLFFEMTRR